MTHFFLFHDFRFVSSSRYVYVLLPTFTIPTIYLYLEFATKTSDFDTKTYRGIVPFGVIKMDY